MDVQAGKEAQQQILQFMTTEHFTLQTARSATIAEANGRCALFMGSVSSAVVAVAFIGQASGLSEGFFLFVLVLFPSLLFLGIFTFKRVLQTAVEDIVYARGINRIRHYYIEPDGRWGSCGFRVNYCHAVLRREPEFTVARNDPGGQPPAVALDVEHSVLFAV